MEVLDAFAKIAPHLANPLVLVGLGLLLFFGIHQTLITSGLLRPPSAKDSGLIVGALLRYGFVIALVIILAGFVYAGVKVYIEFRERVAIATAPKIDVGAIVDTYRDQIAASTERDEAYQEQIRQLTAAVTALMQIAEQPNAPPGVEEALEQLAEGNTWAAEKIFAETLEHHAAEGEMTLKEAAEDARHLGTLALLHDTQKALGAYRKAVAFDPQNSDGWYQLGHLLLRISNLDSAEEAYKTVLELREAGQSTGWQAAAYGNLGLVFATRGELGRAKEMFEKALARYEELGHRESMANAYSHLGIIYRTGGELGRAEEMFEKALALEEELGRKKGVATAYSNLGMVYQSRGEPLRAEEMFEKALALEEEFGRAEQSMADAYGNLGIIYQTRGQLGRAEEMYRKALALVEELGRTEYMASTYALLSILYRSRGELRRAEEMYEKALAGYEELSLAEEMDEKALALNEKLGRKEGIANTYAIFGWLYQTRGELSRAEDALEKTLELFAALGVRPQVERITSWLNDLRVN